MIEQLPIGREEVKRQNIPQTTTYEDGKRESYLWCPSGTTRIAYSGYIFRSGRAEWMHVTATLNLAILAYYK